MPQFKQLTCLLIRLLSLLAVLFGLVLIGHFGYTAIAKIFYTYGLNLGEPALAQTIMRFSQGLWPYRELTSAPYVLTPYGPVYLVLSHCISYFNSAPFVSGRIVTALSSLGLVILIYKCAKDLGAHRIFAWMSAITFILLPYVIRWGVQVNVDMTGICIELLGLWCFVRYWKTDFKHKAWFIGGVAAITLGFFTKSSCMAAGSAFFFALLLHKQWRVAFQYFLIQGGLLLVIYLGLNIFSHGYYYFHTTYEISQRLFFWQFIPIFWKECFIAMPWHCVVAGVFLIIFPRNKIWYLPKLYLILGVILTFSLGKQGSDSNYLLQFCVASSLAIALTLTALFKKMATYKLEYAYVFKIALITLFLFQAHAYGATSLNQFKSFPEYSQTKKEFFDQLSQKIKNIPDPILAWDMSLLVANGKQVYFEPFPMAQMGYSGVWDQNIIIQELKQKKFKLAMLYFYAPLLGGDRNFTPEFLQAFKENYDFKQAIKLPWDQSQIIFFYAPKTD